jgi:flagellar FliL protein
MARPPEPAESVELDEAAENALPGKSKKKLFVILGIFVFLLGGGGVGAWLITSSGSHSAPAEEETASAPSATPLFVPLDTFTVNLQGSDQYLQTDITLQLSDEVQVETVKLHMPRIRNRLLALLSSKHAAELVAPEDKKKLAQEVLTQVRLPLVPKGKPQKVDDVLFTSFVIQ